MIAARREQAVVDLRRLGRRGVGAGSAGGSPCTASRSIAACAVAGRAERAAKAEEIRLEREEARHVRRLQPAGEADEQAVLARAAFTKAASAGMSACVSSRPAPLSAVSSITPGKAGRGEVRNEAEAVALAVGEEHADEARRLRPPRPAHRSAPAAACSGRQADLDVIDAGRGDLLDRRRDGLRLHRQVAGHRARPAAAGDRGDRRLDPSPAAARRARRPPDPSGR